MLKNNGLEQLASSVCYLIVSPVLLAGLSIENHNFDCMFVIANNRSVDHWNLLQMMGRLRGVNNKAIPVYMHIKACQSEFPESEQEILSRSSHPS